MLKTISSARFLVGLVAAIAIAGGAYAFTASNTVPTSNVGAFSSNANAGSAHYLREDPPSREHEHELRTTNLRPGVAGAR